MGRGMLGYLMTGLIILLFVVSIQNSHSSVHKGLMGGIQSSVDGWKTYMKDQYSIQYPANWELDTLGKMGTSFILFAGVENQGEEFKENVNLIVQDLANSNTDLAKFVELSEGQIKKYITNAKIFESKRISVNNTEYHRIIYTGDLGILHLEWEQYYLIVKDKAFILTLTCEKKKFAKDRALAEQILSSFKVKS